MPHPITPESVSRVLSDLAGMAVPPELIELERRAWRWIAHLPGDLIAWVPADIGGAERLAREGRLLQFLAGKVSFGLPSVYYFDPDLRLQVRRKIPGAQLGGGGKEPDFGALSQGLRLGDHLGRALGEFHRAVSPAEATKLGFEARNLLPEADELHSRLKGKLPDRQIAGTFERLLDAYRACKPPSHDIVLIHGDVWGGNMAVDLDSGALNGLFDFDDACIADRHFDFMYAHSFGEGFRERAFTAYAQAAGAKLSARRTALYHAVSAFAALADTRNKGQTYMLAERKMWVESVCRGPVSELALSVA